MQRLTYILCTLILVLILATSATAEEQTSVTTPSEDTGLELLRHCHAAVNMAASTSGWTDAAPLGAGYCIGLLHGVVVTNRVLAPSLKHALFCLLRGITNEQAIRIVITYLQNHPEHLHLHAAEVVIVALNDAYRCQRSAS
jgi:hypothetical protein